MLALHINGAKLFVLPTFLSFSCTGVRPRRALVKYRNRGKYKIIHNLTFCDRCHQDLPVNFAHDITMVLCTKLWICTARK
uniref:Putative secreted protein n=1 Tax=Ixodes ricinus TaxID=34613 RepID=A0A6B0U4C7_IXORI